MGIIQDFLDNVFKAYLKFTTFNLILVILLDCNLKFSPPSIIPCASVKHFGIIYIALLQIYNKTINKHCLLCL